MQKCEISAGWTCERVVSHFTRFRTHIRIEKIIIFGLFWVKKWTRISHVLSIFGQCMTHFFECLTSYTEICFVGAIWLSGVMINLIVTLISEFFLTVPSDVVIDPSNLVAHQFFWYRGSLVYPLPQKPTYDQIWEPFIFGRQRCIQDERR